MDAAAVSRPVEKNPEEMHPLLSNDKLLKQIFSFLPFQDLKNVRLVNPVWCQQSTELVREKCSTIKFLSGSDLGPLEYDIYTMPDFTHLIRTSLNFPCTEFYVDAAVGSKKWNPNELKDKQEVRKETVEMFFQAIGPLATKLTILDDFGESWRSFSVPRGTAFPKLQWLEVHSRNSLAADWFLKDVMLNAPSLLTLKCCADSANFMDEFIMAMNQHGRKVNKLQLYGKIQDKHLDRLLKLRLGLKHLTLEFQRGAEFSPANLFAFLESQRTSLEELCLGSNGLLGNISAISFPYMEKLQTLKISGQETELQERPFERRPLARRGFGLTFSNVSYSKQLPDLKCLSLADGIVPILEHFVNLNMESVYTVQMLELPDAMEDPNLILQVARIFPKLKSLQVPVRSRVMEAVFNAMTGLEELRLVVSNDHVTDSLVWALCGLEGNVKLLEGLRILRVMEKGNTPAPGVTDMALNLVLRKLDGLVCLDLWDSPRSTRVSRKVLQKVRNKFSVLCREESIARK